jgi:hypothetical protein
MQFHLGALRYGQEVLAAECLSRISTCNNCYGSKRADNVLRYRHLQAAPFRSDKSIVFIVLRTAVPLHCILNQCHRDYGLPTKRLQGKPHKERSLYEYARK